MISRVRSWFWARLGGRLGDDGALMSDDEDPLVIFRGAPEAARQVKAHLEACGFAVVAHARVADPRGLAVDMGVSPRPSEVQLEIRSADHAAAKAALESESPSLP